MGCIYVCDGCNMQAMAQTSRLNGWVKPRDWYQRTDVKTGKTYDACSRLCIARLKEDKNVPDLVLPG